MNSKDLIEAAIFEADACRIFLDTIQTPRAGVDVVAHARKQLQDSVKRLSALVVLLETDA